MNAVCQSSWWGEENRYDVCAAAAVIEPTTTAPVQHYLVTKKLYPDQTGLELCESAHNALEGADALVIITEWQEFRSPDFPTLKDSLADAVVFDGRNLYEPDIVGHFGLQYYAIGRGHDMNVNSKFGRHTDDKVL